MSEKSSRSDVVYRLLRQAILEQALRPGTKLAEDTIADHFKVSRTSVRAALVRLNAEGIVDLRANKGACVAEPTLEEARDIFALRRMLEAEVIRRLVADLGSAEVKRLEQHVKQEEAAFPITARFRSASQANSTSCSPNSRARRPWRALSARSSRAAR